MATNVNNRITSTKQVWIVVHEDHYFKHLFYDMSIKCSYVDSKMVGVKITFHDQYQNEAHELNIDTASRDVFDKKIELSVCTILDSIDWIIKSKEFNGNPTIIDGTRFHSIKEIMRMASEIAATDSVEPEREAKLKRFEHLGGFDTKEILYIKAKTSDFDNNLVIDNRDDEYKARQKTSFGSEAKAKEILGVDEFQDSLTKARNMGPNDKQLLDIKDLTFTGKEGFVDENMPKCIRYPILEALRKVDMHCCKIQPVSLFQAGIQQINSALGKAITEHRPQAFIYNAILELCDVVRPKDLIVYKWSNGFILLQIGSWLVNAEYNEGIAVYEGLHKEYKISLLLNKYLSDKAIRYDDFFEVEVNDKGDYIKALSEYGKDPKERIKLEIMTGTEFICKCGKPKDIKMCFAVDGVGKEDKVYATEILHRECREVMKAYSGLNWFKYSVRNEGPNEVNESQLDLQTRFIKIRDFDMLKGSNVVNNATNIFVELNNCYMPWHNVRNQQDKTVEAEKEYVASCKKIVESEAYTKLQDEMVKVIEETWSKIPGYEE